MACTLDPTVGGASANSYASIAEADAYHEAHLYASAWTGDDEQKCKALQMATRALDNGVEWFGQAASRTQRLLWPRHGVIGRLGVVIASTEVPRELKEATAELARSLLVEDRTADSDLETLGLRELQVDTVALTFDGAAAKVLPDAVFYMVEHLGRVKQRGSGVVPLQRV